MDHIVLGHRKRKTSVERKVSKQADSVDPNDQTLTGDISQPAAPEADRGLIILSPASDQTVSI